MPKKFLKTIFAVLILAILVWTVNVHELAEALSHVTWLSAFNLLLISVLLIYISALKWKLFLDMAKQRVGIGELFNLYLLGYFVNLILPSYLGGDMVRSFYAGKKVGQHHAATATILERYTGLSAMLFLGVSFMWFSALVTWQIKLAVLLSFIGLLILTAIALSAQLISVVKKIPYMRPVVPHLEKIQAGFHLARGHRGIFAQAFVLSLLYHCVTVLNTIAAAHIVGWVDVPLWELFVVLPLILLVGALPVSPNGLGLQEGAFLFFLHGIGATPAQALGVGVILRAKSYVLALGGGIIWLVLKVKNKKIVIAEKSI